jgi:16S rRNA (uracil1498-N3)-methyltransferase
MRIPRVYVHASLAVGASLSLEEAQSHYLGKVLRMEAGRPLLVFNGDGREYSARITQAGKRCVEIQILDAQQTHRESPLHTHLAISISRGERMDWVLQKATEIGVSKITPLFTERTEVRLQGERLAKKMEHWRQILISACEQCQRNVLPELAEARELDNFLAVENPGLKLVLHHRSEDTLKQLPTPSAVTLLVGPEGGLSDQEITSVIQNFHYSALTLGPRVLRTETAPVVALTSVQLLWGDLG